MEKEELDTPILLLDLDLLEQNIETMANQYEGKKSNLRPHVKGHRSPMIAKKQLDAGASGISLSTLGLAELMVESGIDDILLTNQIVSDGKIKRAINLSKHSDIKIGVDNLENIKKISEMALERGTKVKVAVELDMGRSGVKIGDPAIKLIEKIVSNCEGVIFQGIWWHDGKLASMKDFNLRKERHLSTLNEVKTLKERIEKRGIPVKMVSGGFTCTWNITPQFEELEVEVQAGNYVFFDWPSSNLEGLEPFDYALTVLTRITSRPDSKRATMDASLHVCSNENSHNYFDIEGPKFKNLEDVESIFLCEENAKVKFNEPKKNIEICDTFELIPPHADTTAKLNDKYYCIRDGVVEMVWDNVGRGAVT